MGFGDSLTDIELSSHKCILHAHKLEALASGLDVCPITVELDPIDRCNHRCHWCVDPRHGKNELSLEFVARLLDELRDLKVAGIVLKGGGEPTLHPRFAEIVDAVRSRGFELGTVTNGSSLQSHAETLVAAASYVRVSLDGPTPSSHHAVHQSHDFDDIVAGVAKLVDERGRRQQRHPVIGLSFAMDFSVIELVDEAVRLGDRLGVDYVLFRTPFFEEVGRQPTMTPQQACQVRQRFDEARGAYRGRMKVLVDHWISDRDAAHIEEIPAASPRRGNCVAHNANGIEHVTGRCLASPLLAVVTADQAVYPCCNLRALDDWSLGQIDYARAITFRQLWEGPRRHELLAKIQRFTCRPHCTHPLSRYNEIVEYLMSPRYHGSFV